MQRSICTLLLPLTLLVLGCEEKRDSIAEMAGGAFNRAPGTGVGYRAVKNLDTSNYNSFINQRDKLVVVMYSASWCAPCRRLGPAIDSVASEFPKSVQAALIDVDAYRDLAVQAGVNGIPDVRFFHNGEEIHQFTGALNRRQLRRLITELTDRMSSGTLTAPHISPELQPLARDLHDVARDFHASPLPPANSDNHQSNGHENQDSPPSIRPMDADWMPPGIERR